MPFYETGLLQSSAKKIFAPRMASAKYGLVSGQSALFQEYHNDLAMKWQTDLYFRGGRELSFLNCIKELWAQSQIFKTCSYWCSGILLPLSYGNLSSKFSCRSLKGTKVPFDQQSFPARASKSL